MSQPTLVSTIALTGGGWFPSNIVHVSTDVSNTTYTYTTSLDPSDSQYYIAYNWSASSKKWFDVNTTTTHCRFGTSATDTTATSRESSANPTVIYGIGGSSLTFQFDNPYYSSSTGSEGTSTGESGVSGTIVDNSTHYTFTVSSSSPSTSGVVAYNVLKDDVLYAVITHTNGATNPMNVYLSSRASSNWKLTIVSSTGLYESAILDTINNARKVFSNFW